MHHGKWNLVGSVVSRYVDAENAPQKMSDKEQMDLLQQIKSLLDAVVLTQEEFDNKKQEILNN